MTKKTFTIVFILNILLLIGNVFAQSGNVINFTASPSQYVRVPANNSVFSGNFTVEFLMKSSTLTEGYILNNRGTNNAGPGVWFNLKIVANKGTLQSNVGSDGGTGISRSTKVVNDNQWHHIAWVRSDTTFSWYVDGNLDTLAYRTWNISNNLPIDIGNWVAFGRQYVGQLDEFRIWNVARDQNDIQSFMIQSLEGNEPGLVYYFKFEEDAANSVSGGTNGTVTNATLVAASGSLPVELTSFSAVSNTSEVVVNWSTASESNNAGWDVEVSGQQSNIGGQQWTKVGFAAGKGTTTEKQSYEFQVESSKFQASSLQFRLKQIDFDGKYSYSKILTVDLTPNSFDLSQNYPNPFNPTTAISYQLSAAGNVKLVVFDLLGHEVATLVNEKKTAGKYTVTLDGSALSSGVYFYKLTAGSFSSVKKMTLVK